MSSTPSLPPHIMGKKEAELLVSNYHRLIGRLFPEFVLVLIKLIRPGTGDGVADFLRFVATDQRAKELFLNECLRNHLHLMPEEWIPINNPLQPVSPPHSRHTLTDMHVLELLVRRKAARETAHPMPAELRLARRLQTLGSSAFQRVDQQEAEEERAHHHCNSLPTWRSPHGVRHWPPTPRKHVDFHQDGGPVQSPSLRQSHHHHQFPINNSNSSSGPAESAQEDNQQQQQPEQEQQQSEENAPNAGKMIRLKRVSFAPLVSNQEGGHKVHIPTVRRLAQDSVVQARAPSDTPGATGSYGSISGVLHPTTHSGSRAVFPSYRKMIFPTTSSMSAESQSTTQQPTKTEPSENISKE